jgi:hypothetical protein
MRNQMAQTRQHGISQLKKNKTEIKCNDESDQPDNGLAPADRKKTQ